MPEHLETARTEEEINDVVNKCMEQEDEGGSRWPGMTYEQGLSAALRWIMGETNECPYED